MPKNKPLKQVFEPALDGQKGAVYCPTPKALTKPKGRFNGAMEEALKAALAKKGGAS